MEFTYGNVTLKYNFIDQANYNIDELTNYIYSNLQYTGNCVLITDISGCLDTDKILLAIEQLSRLLGNNTTILFHNNSANYLELLCRSKCVTFYIPNIDGYYGSFVRTDFERNILTYCQLSRVVDNNDPIEVVTNLCKNHVNSFVKDRSIEERAKLSSMLFERIENCVQRFNEEFEKKD